MKRSGLFKRFIICLVVYAMLSTAIISVLIKVFPNGFKTIGAKLGIIGGFVALFIIGFSIIEWLHEKKG